ncbi:IS200/IS605 family transposase [Salinibacter ruber]|jgi:putative transposase|nr:IS200/IS605 family transposase [Salinibacter ruber]MCS3663395.1 putative transposase [Salinibacter ruber]MCS3683838.1 putative transposase [Salinibacter ruber]MCS3705938.1 putative transposase [Salinibacter ruber]MCS3853357.1 putative transposase [Salinibacter ruber]MCS3857888.1 putative transposase [Salinibacter ruber]
MPVNKEPYQWSRHAVHAVKYNFVWCLKRRAKVLKNEIANRLEQVLFDVADEHDWEIGSLAIRPDHVHLFVQADTRHAPYQVIHRFKEKSAHVLRKEFDQLHRLPSLWTRSYFVSTTGKVSEEIVGRYIEDQS